MTLFLSKVRYLSQILIFHCVNFHEQQNFQLKTTMNYANERDSSFQIQNFVISVQFNINNQDYVKALCRLCISFESEYRLTHINLRSLYQRHLKTTL